MCLLYITVLSLHQVLVDLWVLPPAPGGVLVKYPWVISHLKLNDALYIVLFQVLFWWLQQLNLAQASQYESTEEHDPPHSEVQILSDLIMLQKINGSKAWALMTSGIALLPTNSNLGQMRIMEMNIWLLEPLFILYFQIFNINIWILVMSRTLFGITKMVSKSTSTASSNLLYFTL